MPQDKKTDELSNYSMGRLAKEFDELATGRQQIPKKRVESDFNKDFDAIERNLHDYMVQYGGPLFTHFLASVPNSLEELIRIDKSIINCSKLRQNCKSEPILYWECEAFDGTNAKALKNQLAENVITLTTSPNASNSTFFHQGNPNGCYWENIPFYSLDSEYRYSKFHGKFKVGFDYCLELAGLQFYGTKRKKHIQQLKTNLKKDGLLIMLHKIKPESLEEYKLRENVKDSIFKTNYFTKAEISWKRKRMLDEMHTGLITLKETIEHSKQVFNHVALTWNATTFVEIVCTDDKKKFDDFIEAQGVTRIDQRFVFESPIPKIY